MSLPYFEEVRERWRHITCDSDYCPRKVVIVIGEEGYCARCALLALELKKRQQKHKQKQK